MGTSGTAASAHTALRTTLSARSGSQKHRQFRNEAVPVDGEVVAGEERRVVDWAIGEFDPTVRAVDDGPVDMEGRHNVGQMSAVERGDLVAASIGRAVWGLERRVRREQGGERLLAVSGGDLDVSIGSGTRVKHDQ